MRSPFLISPDDGKLYDRADYERKSLAKSLRKVAGVIASWDLKSSRLIMNQADWDDIVKFSKED
jgi:hypothetical protein